MASVPQNNSMYDHEKKRRELLTLITQSWSLNKPTAVCLQHMSDLYIIWFTEKCLLECLCMNLNFKLFLSFYWKHRPILREKLCKYLFYFISRKRKKCMCRHSINNNVSDRGDARLRPIHPDLNICFMNVLFFTSEPARMFITKNISSLKVPFFFNLLLLFTVYYWPTVLI